MVKILKKQDIIKFIVTFGYLGKIKYCPGTFGSLAAFPLSYIIVYFMIANQIVFSFSALNLVENELLTFFTGLLFFSIILFIAGIYCSNQYLKYTVVTDPQEVVIDEVAGQMLMVALCTLGTVFVQYSTIGQYLSSTTIDWIFLFLLPLLLFRFFDIVKPWPINWLDQNVKGGLGIMIDDIVAAIFASVIYYAVIFTIIDLMRPNT